jgi:hypothetical protein
VRVQRVRRRRRWRRCGLFSSPQSHVSLTTDSIAQGAFVLGWAEQSCCERLSAVFRERNISNSADSSSRRLRQRRMYSDGWVCGGKGRTVGIAPTLSEGGGGGLDDGLRPASAPSVDTPPPTSPVAAPTVTRLTNFPARCRNNPSPRRPRTGRSASRLVVGGSVCDGRLVPRARVVWWSRPELAAELACRYGSSDEYPPAYSSSSYSAMMLGRRTGKPPVRYP